MAEKGRQPPSYLPPSPQTVGRAAVLDFTSRQTDEAIAAQLGVARRTLCRWKQRPEYVAARHALDCFYRQQFGYSDAED